MRKFAKKFTKLKQKFRIFSRTFSFGGNPSLYPCMQDTWNAGIIKLYEELKSNTTDIKMENKKRTRPPEILKRAEIFKRISICRGTCPIHINTFFIIFSIEDIVVFSAWKFPPSILQPKSAIIFIEKLQMKIICF